VRTPQRSVLGLLLALVMAVVVWWTQGDGGTPDPGAAPTSAEQGTREGSTRTASPSPSPSPSSSSSSKPGTGRTDPVSGLPLVALAQLPPEAADTVELIDAGGPFPEERDGVTFENREDLLPDEPRGYYAEYTVPTPGSDDRGARRIVAGDGGELYWTQDHYSSFGRIVR
jgi:ribonuclease T1